MDLLFALDRGYIPAFLNCLRSILLNGGMDGYNVYVLHSDLDAPSQDAVRAALGDAGQCRFICVDPSLFDGLPVTKRYPRQIYYRIAAPMLLPSETERVLYLDADTLVINPLRELYAMDFTDAYYIACTHTRRLTSRINQIRLGLGEDVPYVNTGVMVLNLAALREHLRMEDVHAYALEHQHTMLLPDQDIITSLYGEHILLADSLRFNLSDRLLAVHNATPAQEKLDLDWVRENTSIVHYCGRNKPWGKNPYHGILDIFYHELKGGDPA